MHRTSHTASRLDARIAYVGLVALSLAIAACSKPQPRTFADFIEDRMVMEGTLARCNEDRDRTLNDIECANARRAASALALRIEQQRRQDLERESERKLAELRDQLAMKERSEREALAAAAAAKEAAYEALWNSERAKPPADVNEDAASFSQIDPNVPAANPAERVPELQLAPRPFRESTDPAAAIN
jgi:hypothetical protein